MRHIYFLFAICMVITLAGCAQAPSPNAGGSPQVKVLDGFRQPESCYFGTWGGKHGVFVSDGGCGYEQPCHQNKAGAYGAVIFVADDGSRTTVMDGLSWNNGVAQDSQGNVWVADDGHGAVAVKLASTGLVIRIAAPGGLLNDVEAIPGESGVYVSDSKRQQILLFGIAGDRPFTEAFASSDQSPNGIAPAWDGDGIVVAGLGDFKTPGASGPVTQIDPTTDPKAGACAAWRGGASRMLASPGTKKWDGITQFTHDGTKGYLVSSIYDNVVGAQSGGGHGLDTTLWFVPATGGAPELIFNAAPWKIEGASDIGRDPTTGAICVPDSNGANGSTKDFDPIAKVLIVTGLH